MEQHKPLIIAVLDDEEQMRKALRRLLSTHGFLVQTYASGQDLLRSLAYQRPDCLVLDLHMPDMSGFDVLRTIEEQDGKLPTIVITGHDTPGTADRVRSLGAGAYLMKPVDELILVGAIERETHSHP